MALAASGSGRLRGRPAASGGCVWRLRLAAGLAVVAVEIEAVSAGVWCRQLAATNAGGGDRLGGQFTPVAGVGVVGGGCRWGSLCGLLGSIQIIECNKASAHTKLPGREVGSSEEAVAVPG